MHCSKGYKRKCTWYPDQSYHPNPRIAGALRASPRPRAYPAPQMPRLPTMLQPSNLQVASRGATARHAVQSSPLDRNIAFNTSPERPAVENKSVADRDQSAGNPQHLIIRQHALQAVRRTSRINLISESPKFRTCRTCLLNAVEGTVLRIPIAERIVFSSNQIDPKSSAFRVIAEHVDLIVVIVRRAHWDSQNLLDLRILISGSVHNNTK